jgi:hypothetical protein
MPLSAADQLVLQTIELCSPSHWSIIERALAYRSIFARFGEVSDGDVKASIISLLESEIIQLVDENALSNIHAVLVREKCHGPIFGLPQIGSFDFTLSGAAQWAQERDQNRQASNERWTVLLERQNRYYCVTNAAITRITAACDQCNQRQLCDPIPTSKWRVVEWEHYAEGFILDFIEHNSDLVPRRMGGYSRRFSPLQVSDLLFFDFTSAFLGKFRFGTIQASRVMPHISDAEFVCLTLVSGLFGTQPVLKECVVSSLQQVFAGAPIGNAIGPIQVVDGLIDKNMIGIARTIRPGSAAPRDELQGIKDTAMPTGDDCVVLTTNGVNELLSFRQHHSKRNGWSDYVVAEQIIEESNLEYFVDSSAALAAAAHYANASEKHLVSEVEPIGKWCVNWWDVRDTGFRFKVRSAL